MDPGITHGAVFLLLLAVVPASLIAALDRLLVASWVVTIPYLLFVIQELSSMAAETVDLRRRR